MPRYKNLADPDFEPSDEQLLELTMRAFAHIREENVASNQEMQDRIAKKQLALFRQMTVLQPT